MREYKYNCFVEDIMYKCFSDVLDMTCIYDRTTYKCLFTLCEYYYNKIVLAKLANTNLDMLVYDIVDSVHEIASHMNNISIEEFMILHDCFNAINAYLNIDTRIDFDDYNDIENTNITYYDYSDAATTYRNQFSFHDYRYCTINITEYIRQYEKHDIYYYTYRYKY